MLFSSEETNTPATACMLLISKETRLKIFQKCEIYQEIWAKEAASLEGEEYMPWELAKSGIGSGSLEYGHKMNGQLSEWIINVSLWIINLLSASKLNLLTT